MTEELEHFHKYRSLYEEAVLRYVCTRCIDFGSDGACHSEDPKGCAVFRYLPELITIAKRVHEPRIEPYVDEVRQTVCVHCRALTPEGMCPLRAKLDCGLDRYLVLVIEVIERVNALLKNEEKDRARLSNSSKNITALLMQRCETILDKIDSVNKTLEDMCYLGKESFEKNLKQINKVVNFFSREWNKHMAVEREIMFPFVIQNVPEIRPSIDFLESKHAEFKKSFQEFRSDSEHFKWVKDDNARKRAMEKIQKNGQSLIDLFKNYIEVESRNVYKILDQELDNDEKLDLMRRIYLRNISRRAA